MKAVRACVAAAVLLFAAYVSPHVIPYNMDEFVHYHALGCASAPLQRSLPAFRDGCGLYDLRLPFTEAALPLRSYYYIGSVPVLPFYPFWRLLHDPVAVRVQGAVFFLLWVALTARLLGVRASTVTLAALVFPMFLTAFLVDEGPVGLSAILFAAALIALRRAVRPGAGVARWGALAGLLLFLGAWSKLVFVCLLPAAAVFAIRHARAGGGGWKALLSRHWRAGGATLAAFVVPMLVLLSCVDVEGRPYAAALRRGRLSLAPTAFAERVARLVKEAVDPDEEAPRNVLLRRSVLDPLPSLVAITLLVAGPWKRSRAAARGGASPGTTISTNNIVPADPVASAGFSTRASAPLARAPHLPWSALALLTLALLALSEYCQWPHHVFYALLLLTPALALGLDLCGRRLRLVALVAVVACWASLAVRWTQASFPVESSPDKDRLLRFVRERALDRETVQVHTSWGTYYIAQLFGDPARAVVYLRALSDDPAQLNEVASLPLARQRPLLVISSRRWERLQTPAVEAAFGAPLRSWRFGEWWAVEYAPRPKPTAASR